METRKRVLGQEHPSTLTSMANLAMTYLRQGRRTEAKELQVEAVNQLRTTLGEDHPFTVAAIANLASFHEERVAPAPCSEANDLMENYNDEIGPSKASSIEPDEGNGTDEERLRRAPAMPTTGENDNDEIGSFKATSIEQDEGNETDEERLQRALAMSTMNENSCEEFVASNESSPHSW